MQTKNLSMWAALAVSVQVLGAPAFAASVLPFGQNADSDSGASIAPDSDRGRALICMATAIAYEAGFEPVHGQQAVGEVILNRMRHPAYPKSICGVVFQGSARRTGCQFTFTCDGALQRPLSSRVMIATRAVAERLLNGEFSPTVGGATHYHANYVSPYWAPSLVRVGQIGAHIFYRAPGSPDAPARYAGGAEPVIAALGPWLGAIDPLTQGKRTSRNDATAPSAAPEAAYSGFSPWGIPVR